MSVKRGHYNTRQQAFVMELLEAHAGEALTIEEICDALSDRGSSVGRTTVYRLLGKLSSLGRVIQVADVRGGPSRYCRISGEGTYLVCLGCHRVFPLSCDGFETFVRHISGEHDFDLELRSTVLHGYCGTCARGAHEENQGITHAR
ncbi:Fe2+/Zn2+ uptake regulation protein [Coriobacterium glomerans PW2]|uniref:Fe2+/Zn2+ uptake regulation protein n=1 Tax=Coriobacterium glomerans (strain ATCC 49209 / DSM 20642 / JCM 10262 / PW2) TaxID=700015 RepID=F2NAU5_CORGP|nr:transcriptional repressor [Coriobacterium glomerans]AEB07623.1 Fe2+/Zn2+ uptake regulation protein [Coriobacterium glomerans PW2]